jgi:hypothetical protein
MDVNTIIKATDDLKKFETFPIASCVCKACQIHNPECDFDKFYDDCKLHMVEVGHQAGLDDTIIDTYYYNQCMSETLDMFGVLELYHNKPPSEHETLVRRLLTYVCRFKHIDDCLEFEAPVSNVIVKFDNQITCIRHLHRRFIEKLMTIIFVFLWIRCQQPTKLQGNVSARNFPIHQYSGLQTNEYPGNYKVPYDTKTDKIAEVKFDDSHAK